MKLVQCQPRLNHKIQPIVVEGVHFNHTQPIPKGFCHFSLFKGHPLLGVLGAWMTFRKAEVAQTVRNGLSRIETNPLNHNWLDFAI